MKEVTEYKWQEHKDIKNTGYSQYGYQTILSYDSWKEKICKLENTTLDLVNVSEISFGEDDEVIFLSDLKDWINCADNNFATHVRINDIRETETKLMSLTAFKLVERDRNDDEYYAEYIRYVNLLNRENYKIDYAEQSRKEMEAVELHEFLNAKRIYESLKHKFEP